MTHHDTFFPGLVKYRSHFTQVREATHVPARPLTHHSPAAQSSQAACPALAWYCPAPQLRQLFDLHCPAAPECFPARHSMHSLLPVAGWYRPAVHSVQEPAAAEPAYRPRSQSQHLLLPDPANLPATQPLAG